MIRFLRWALGFDPLDLLHDRLREAQEERNRTKVTLDEVQRRREAEHALHQKELSTARNEASHARSEVSRLRQMLELEQNARGLYEQVLMEAGEQIDKNKSVSPATTLGVLRTVFVEALGTVAAWRAGAPVEQAMLTNLRATMANRLLPEPKRLCGRPGCHHEDKDHHDEGSCKLCSCQHWKPPTMVTTRNRTGKAGDSASQPHPRIAHAFEWGPYNVSSKNPLCAVRGCGQPFGDPIHSPTVGWSPPAPDSAAPPRVGLSSEALPRRHAYESGSDVHSKGPNDPPPLCAYPGCGREWPDPIHRHRMSEGARP